MSTRYIWKDTVNYIEASDSHLSEYVYYMCQLARMRTRGDDIRSVVQETLHFIKSEGMLPWEQEEAPGLYLYPD
jgi:hypothetical protein